MAEERCPVCHKPLVHMGFQCPECGERHMDELVWLDVDCTDKGVQCRTCRHIYDPMKCSNDMGSLFNRFSKAVYSRLPASRHSTDGYWTIRRFMRESLHQQPQTVLALMELVADGSVVLYKEGGKLRLRPATDVN